MLHNMLLAADGLDKFHWYEGLVDGLEVDDSIESDDEYDDTAPAEDDDDDAANETLFQMYNNSSNHDALRHLLEQNVSYRFEKKILKRPKRLRRPKD